MKKQTKYQLSEEQEQQLEEAISHDERPEVVRRATAVRMLHLGYKPEAVAGALVVGRTTISNWWGRWQAGGIEGLANRPKSGRPRQASESYWEQLEKTLQTDPTSLGYPFTVWTVERLRDHLHQETGIALSGERLRVQMRQRGYVWRRPKHVLTVQQDAETRQEALALLDGLKKEPLREPLSFSIWTKRA